MRNNLKTAYTTIDEQFNQLELSRSEASNTNMPKFQPGDLVLHYVPVAPQGKKSGLQMMLPHGCD